MWRWIKRLFLFGFWAVVLLVLALLACNVWVTGSTATRVFSEVDRVPYNEVGLVLGTSKRVAAGQENLHFTHRMEAAAKLYKAGKVDHLLVSGDNSEKYYNEPKDMRIALVKLGVPASAITLDYAGFRTLDSMARAREVFELDSMTVISDGFHVGRAVFIARRFGIDARAFAAEPVEVDKSFKSRARELLARVKAILDLYVLDTDPTVLGDKEPITVLRRGKAVPGSAGGGGAQAGEHHDDE